MNKLKIIIALLFCFCTTISAYAQEVIYSAYEKFDIRTDNFGVAGKVGDLLYVYRGGGNDGYYLDAYNANMERVATVVLDFFKGRVYETRFITYTDHMIVFYQSVEGGKITEYAAMLDDKGRLKKGPLNIDNEKTGLFGASRTFFYTAVSEDKKKLLVYSIEGGRKDFSAKCIWMDDQLAITGRGNASFTADNDIAQGEALLHNNGTIYLPAYTPVGSRSYADQVWLLTLRQGERKFTAVEMALDKKYAAGTYMKLDAAKDRIYVGGFYSDKKNGNYEGVLYTYFDVKTASFIPVKEIPLEERLRNATGEQSKKKAFNDYQVRQLIVKNDGGFVLVAEDYFITTRNSYSSGLGYYSFYYPTMSSNVREYHYNDVLSMSYDTDGQMDWHTFIRKNQYSQEDGGMFSSYALVNTGGAIGFLFNDFNTARSRVQLASMDANGKASVSNLDAGAAPDLDWLPRSAKQISSREIVVPCLRKRQICFAKVVF